LRGRFLCLFRPLSQVSLLLLAFCPAWTGVALAQTPPQNASPDELASQKDQAEILQEADDIFAEVSRLRGLPIKHPVEKKFANRAFFHDYYLRLLQAQYPPEKKRAYEKAFTLLGFLPPKADLIQTYLDSFLKVVEGLYDPKTKTLYIADWIRPGDQESTLAHELTHALQDQYFDLQSYLNRGENLSMDTQFARASIMEGEAVAVALDISLEDRNTDFTKVVNIAEWVRLSNLLDESAKQAFAKKVVLNQVISFPYVYGVTFLQGYVRAYGWSGMDYLFRHPPTSTHQIMHPESFFPRRHNPVGIQIDDLSKGPLTGFNKIWENTFGEYGLMTLLQQYMTEQEARNSVRGWRGDRVQVYENAATHRLLMVGYVLFDDEDTANDFFAGYKSLLDSKYEIDLFRRSDDTIQWVSVKGDDREAYVERFGRRVVMIEGTDSSLTARVRGALWDVKAHKMENGR
jgi:hypothetical protein